MKKTVSKIASAALALILLLGTVPAAPIRADESAAPSSVVGKTISAAYTDETITVNGKITEDGWNLSTLLTDEVQIGVQWNLTTLYIAARTPNKEEISVTLNGTEITKSNATVKTATNKKLTEYSVDFAVLGIDVNDYGVRIPAKFEADGTVWEGTILLSSTAWFIANNASNTENYSSVSRKGLRLVDPESRPTSNQNISKITGGYKFFDTYAPNGQNPPAICTQITYSGNKYTSLGDRTADTVIGFTFRANSMPVYRLGEGNDFYPYIMAGFTWYAVAYNINAPVSYIDMGIVNTELGLVFVLRNAECDRTYILDKYEGDTFYIETIWTKEGTVILSVDGEQLAVFENAEMPHEYHEANSVTLGILRSVNPAESEEDNFDVDVSGLSVGKSYGDSLLDSLTFDTIKNEKRTEKNEQYFTKYDLSLPSTFSTAIFPAPVAIEWTSSDPDVIDPATGKVTQPEKTGKLVTLTAAAPSLGTSTSIDVYVLGLAPQDDVLISRNDTAAYKGKGVVIDAHEFTFDTANNSIIRDQKESKTVNVITLTDSDTVCRLNESNLTVWVSEDNEEYTQIESFKMLRDERYTYLYDFEATGRYIKVHFTLHSETDASFTAPLEDMITVSFADVFGDGGSDFATKSFVKVENGTDAAMTDTVAAVSPETAGVVSLADNFADVRFFLDGELLYHCYDGENFLVRVKDIPAGESVTLTVLSGNKDAKDISNTEAIYEVIYGTRETGTGYRGAYYITLNNGVMMGFHGQGGTETGQPYYFLSLDGGVTRTQFFPMPGSYGVFCNPHGSGYDDVSGRIFVQGYMHVDGQTVGGIVYSDNNGKLWQKAEITYEMEGDAPFSHTYGNIHKVSSYDGEDGPNVDLVLPAVRNSDVMREHYDTEYFQGEMRFLYSRDNGKTWTVGAAGVRFYDGEGNHIREMGLTEVSLLESDGVLVAYARCQYDNTDHFAYGVSYDFGVTWSKEATLSNIYATNTQPELFELNGNQYLLWGGNNVYGCNSFQRFPMNVAVSTDGLMTFTDIQDLFLQTEFHGLTKFTSTFVMNPNAAVYEAEDRLLVSWLGDNMLTSDNYRTIYIDNFTDYFMRTKGAYDSFERTDAHYEGWTNTGGEVLVSDTHASVGDKSLMLSPNSSAARSIPAVSDGTLSFDLYIEDVSSVNLEIELESAHGPDYGKAAPIAFTLVGDQLTFIGAASSVKVALKEGWNHFEFDLSMESDTPSATLSVGGETISVPVNAEIGDYVCYLHIVCKGELSYWLDSFLVEDMDHTAKPTVAAYVADSETETDPAETDTSFTDDPSTTGTGDPAVSGEPSVTTPGADGSSSPIVWIVIGAVALAGVAVGIALVAKAKK